MKGIHRRLGIPVNPSSWKTAPYPWWCPRERNEICHWLPEVNRSYFWCYLVWHNQICPENQVIYLCSGQLKKKKKFNPTWPFLRCSQRKTDFFFELDNPLLSLLQTPEQPQLCSNSRALNGPWQIYSLATDPQRREDWGTLFVLLWDKKGKTFYGRLKREKTREKERHDSLIHHVSKAEINLKKSLDSHNQPFFLMEKFAWVRLSQRPPESRLGPLLQFVFINLI